MEMTELGDLDELIKKIRIDRVDLERKEKLREEEYKKATRQFINALRKETEALEKNNGNYDRRNQSFREEVKGIQDRTRIGSFNLIKTQDRLKNEREKLNQYMLDKFPKLATEVRDKLVKQKMELEHRIKTTRDFNENPYGNKTEVIRIEGPSDAAVVKEKRMELERDIYEKRRSLNMEAAPVYESNVHFLNRFIDGNKKEDKNYLNEYIAYPGNEEILYPYKTLDAVKATTPQYLRNSYRNSQTQNPNNTSFQPKTDLLSGYLYKIPATKPVSAQPVAPTIAVNNQSIKSFNYQPVNYQHAAHDNSPLSPDGTKGKAISPMRASLSLNFSPI
jgi:hypothetical protein